MRVRALLTLVALAAVGLPLSGSAPPHVLRKLATLLW